MPRWQSTSRLLARSERGTRGTRVTRNQTLQDKHSASAIQDPLYLAEICNDPSYGKPEACPNQEHLLHGTKAPNQAQITNLAQKRHCPSYSSSAILQALLSHRSHDSYVCKVSEAMRARVSSRRARTHSRLPGVSYSRPRRSQLHAAESVAWRCTPRGRTPRSGVARPLCGRGAAAGDQQAKLVVRAMCGC